VRHRRNARTELVFVSVRHQIDNAHGPCLTEDHDLVYLAAHPRTPSESTAADGPVAAVQATTAGAWQRRIVPDDVLLFRYSALTFNGFRIHYDHRYARAQGYPGLVVHAPLIATLLLDLAATQLPHSRLRRFEMRALAPSYDQVPLTLAGRPSENGNVDLWAIADGVTVMRAGAVTAIQG
jgi:3-methylfumaryl-CoA hydratase